LESALRQSPGKWSACKSPSAPCQCEGLTFSR
jgi:hypothetical protein